MATESTVDEPETQIEPGEDNGDDCRACRNHEAERRRRRGETAWDGKISLMDLMIQRRNKNLVRRKSPRSDLSPRKGSESAIHPRGGLDCGRVVLNPEGAAGLEVGAAAVLAQLNPQTFVAVMHTSTSRRSFDLRVEHVLRAHLPGLS